MNWSILPSESQVISPRTPRRTGSFAQSMDRHDREKLLDRPAIGHRLEDRQVAGVGVRQQGFHALELLGHVIQLAHHVQELVAQGPEEPFGQGAVFDGQVAEVEEAHGLVHRLQGVVIAFQVVFLGELAVDSEQVGDRLRRVLGDLRRRLVLVEVGDAEHVEDQHAMVGDHRPARLGEDRRVGDLGLVADVLDPEDDVVGVFLKRVVDRRHKVGLRAVVVDAQAAADVEVLDPGARPGPSRRRSAPLRSGPP